MAGASRVKGRRAEAEVAAIYRAHGFAVRGLEGSGDHLCIRGEWVIHSEVKRQETLRLPLWARQAAREAPFGAIPVVAYRGNREPWRAAAPLAPVQRKRQLYDREAVTPPWIVLNGAAWIDEPLADLLERLR